MAMNSSEVEQVVARTLRDSLAKLQQTTAELDQAVSDLVAACASSRPSNSLPPMVRARSSAAALAASLEVLSKFIISAMQSSSALDVEELAPLARAVVVPSAPTRPAEVANTAGQVASNTPSYEPPALEPSVPDPPADQSFEYTIDEPVAEIAQHEAELHDLGTAPSSEPEAPAFSEAMAMSDNEPLPGSDLSEELPPEEKGFDVLALSPGEQEMHRRANRVAKVSMQDVKMLRPKDVVLGKEHKDICVRLRDDIEKARKEYDRRFQAILDQPVDYFYDWMVQILGDGDPETLGEYPYPSPVLRR
jgi:hypothetical protein